MYVAEDYSEEIQRRTDRLLDGILSRCVTIDIVIDEGFSLALNELNGESCFDRNWRGLAGKLLKPPLNSATIERISKTTNPARKLLKTWVEQREGSKTFQFLIATMLAAGVYSACDELLDFLESFKTDSRLNSEQCAENLDEIISTVINDETPRDHTRTVNEQNQQRPVELALESRRHVRRSHSWPPTRLLRRFSRIFRRTISDTQGGQLPEDPSPSPPLVPPPPPEDEIFVVSSNFDNQTKGMKDLMSFVNKLEPVAKGMLRVKTIHDVEQNGLMTPSWLEERVTRARYVILCFSSVVKAIADQRSGVSQYDHQGDYNLKFTLDFLVTGKLYIDGCLNRKGKFLPVLLPGNDLSTLIVPLKYFLHFSWPSEEEKISKYIMNLPERPIPRQGTPIPLVPREFAY